MEYYLAEGNDEDLKGDIGYIYDIYIKNFANR